MVNSRQPHLLTNLKRPDFHRFWAAPTEPAHIVGVEPEERLEQVLYVYENETDGRENPAFRWTSVDRAKPIHISGQHGIGPSVYKRTYTLFPRPGYRQRKWCCFWGSCGVKPVLCVILLLLLALLAAILISVYIVKTVKNEGTGDSTTPEAINIPVVTTGTNFANENRSQASESTVVLVVVKDTFNESFDVGFQPQPPASTPKTTLTTKEIRPTGEKIVRPPPVFNAVPVAAFTSMTFMEDVTEKPISDVVKEKPLSPQSNPELRNICNSPRCHRNGQCNGGQCRCKPGYEGDGIRVCININECVRSKGICGCNAKCADVPGSFRCHCKYGYEKANGSTKCIDVDECKVLISPCPMFAQCVNVSGGYRCICESGAKISSDGSECEKEEM